MWALPEIERVPRWEWRGRRGGAREDHRQVAQAVPPAAWSGFAGGARRTCGKMVSCAETRFHHERCGVSRLDGDRDGVPRERLWRWWPAQLAPAPVTQ